MAVQRTEARLGCHLKGTLLHGCHHRLPADVAHVVVMGEVVAEAVAVAVVRVGAQGVQNLDSHGLDVFVALDQRVRSTVLTVSLHRSMAGREVSWINIHFAQ